ncbi:DUF1848 domain-containing protein [Desulfonatronum thiodismutans]|uniref:DUF1848 domain-containing protein n=1 Tax=Desulfonatronum thiodismutans TaxID=159290 RepID=UPI000A0238C2|nr:DUF1848 domain-containing protein [Desulfonatronum thiodismutans]
MIISASRRTDIPAFYADWFINRLKAGYVLVRNPFNANQVSKVLLHPSNVDCIVFWTKNPLSMINKLHEIDRLGFKYYFQFTITSYDQNFETNLPVKKSIIQTFQELSNEIGKEKVVWRYDPILLTTDYSVVYHEKWFSYLAENLCGYTNKCVISFIDMYKKCERNLKNISLETISEEIKKQLANSFSKSANFFGISVESCAEIILLSKFGVNPGKCIDDQLISKIIGDQLSFQKDKTQRKECGCVRSIDIGSYNTCKHGCKYCYANYSEKAVVNNCKKHETTSPFLVGNLCGDEKITERKVQPFRLRQRKLFL